MMIAHGDTALHVASHTCVPTLEGIEIQWTAGFAPGGTEIFGRMILTPDEAILIAACVEDILDALKERIEKQPLDICDEVDHLSAQVRGSIGE